ncbi:TatD family hydrolase [Curvibacter sp. HBC28]|uniref:TatD family hydrolase n=1 Tax=Curvibacter microcysteis TaxID=3026419 RepID=A0ABT5MJ71_9BURK|nr:TatD family hydrolase [Curvibacter sp. HBC28]MDD0816624.1 TatD family hydrolase [Curvibacter sp. HBC28]
MLFCLDTHCHLDAPELAPDLDAVRQQARSVGVGHCVLPAVQVDHFDAVRTLAHRFGDSYALGVHPLYSAPATQDDMDQLAAELQARIEDPRLVAVGEIGLDGFVPGLDMAHQQRIYRAQLQLARRHDLPVILHVRRSADLVLAGLRAVGGGRSARWQGIAHAFNGSLQQAQAFIDMGFKLGFGGALTFDRALQLRRLATELPLSALVLETDAPDIPPHWLYRSAAERDQGLPQGRNTPAELPRIAQVLADLRGLPLEAVLQATTCNACEALPRLASLLPAEALA